MFAPRFSSLVVAALLVTEHVYSATAATSDSISTDVSHATYALGAPVAYKRSLRFDAEMTKNDQASNSEERLYPAAIYTYFRVRKSFAGLNLHKEKVEDLFQKQAYKDWINSFGKMSESQRKALSWIVTYYFKEDAKTLYAILKSKAPGEKLNAADDEIVSHLFSRLDHKDLVGKIEAVYKLGFEDKRQTIPLIRHLLEFGTGFTMQRSKVCQLINKMIGKDEMRGSQYYVEDRDKILELVKSWDAR